MAGHRNTRSPTPAIPRLWPGRWKGSHAAYYLIHSLLLGRENFESTDIQAAENFRKAAERSGTTRIIYLGGLGDIKSPLSPHLRAG